MLSSNIIRQTGIHKRRLEPLYGNYVVKGKYHRLEVTGPVRIIPSSIFLPLEKNVSSHLFDPKSQIHLEMLCCKIEVQSETALLVFNSACRPLQTCFSIECLYVREHSHTETLSRYLYSRHLKSTQVNYSVFLWRR